MRAKTIVIIIMVASALGFTFSAVSTFDAMMHLDRQVHGVHCSFLPGMDVADVSGTSGCYTTMMSSFSAVLADSIWGGIPVSLPAMSVFAFIVWCAAWMLTRKRELSSRAAGFLFAAITLPFLTSLVMGYVAFVLLDANCKLCIGIYAASTVMFIAGAILWSDARKAGRFADDESAARGSKPSLAFFALVFCLGVLFVAVPFLTYAAIAPDYTHYVGNCGELTYRHDGQDVLVPVGPQDRETEMIEVFDPLCQACGAFEQRFGSMPASSGVSRKILLFPLENTCNWMVGESIHPGACAVSEAVLCAGAGAEAVMQWAFDEQEAIVTSSAADPKAAYRMVMKRFPSLRNCIGSTQVRARLNRVLRWAVKNQLQVLTPQVFINGLRLCDEDTDLGLEYALPKLIARAKATAKAAPAVAPEKQGRRPLTPIPPPIPPPAPAPQGEVQPDTDGAKEDSDPPKPDPQLEKVMERASEHADRADTTAEVSAPQEKPKDDPPSETDEIGSEAVPKDADQAGDAKEDSPKPKTPPTAPPPTPPAPPVEISEGAGDGEAS